MNATVAHPSIDRVWTWLAEVPDSEIPVVSIVDLGIVRAVEWDDDTLVVTVTPTYSSCPATSVINFEIEEKLRNHGIEKLRLNPCLSPAWTTAWISENARARLRDYGIAPTVDGTAACGAGAGLADFVVACPRCGSEATEKVSHFGSTPCKASYRCADCLEPFDYFKCI